MADTGKRVELSYGAFACAIEGYDDPVAKMREVLALMQRMIAETPALADTDCGLDDDQFARLDQALADWRGETDDRGVIIIRSGSRIAGDAEDAEILTVTAQGEEQQAEPWHRAEQAPPDGGGHPSAAAFSAPAAAVAEAAFAASMAADESDTHERSPSEAPLGEDRDDGAGAAEPAWGEEAAAERRAAHGALVEDAADADGVPHGGAWTTPSGTWPAAAEPEAEGRAEPSPRLNIFAPPPAEVPAPRERRASIFRAPPAEPLVSLRLRPGPGTEAVPAAPMDDGYEAEELDEVQHEGAGERSPASEPSRQAAGETDRSEAGPSESAENRLAALITRYQSGLHERAAAAAQHADAGGLSAADLADRAGAVEVADLLAISAAWLTLAGGRPRFSRREVMEVFETLPGEHQRTLEARIKGFGKLVRSGTLMLVDDGAFAMPPHERERFRELMDQR